MAEHGSGFEQLTWDDLTSWAGAKILSRGKSYKRQVSDLRRTNDGGILAWVHGTKRYVTVARRDSSGTLSAVCSCPYAWSPCKHSVAAVLAHLDSVKNKQDVPQVAKSDRRLKLIEDHSSQEIVDAFWETFTVINYYCRVRENLLCIRSAMARTTAAPANSAQLNQTITTRR